MTTYRIGSILVRPNQPDISSILAEAYKEIKANGKLRPMCMCNGEPGFPMYIVKVNDNYYVKRMPNTGREHAEGCGSWEMADEFSGRKDLIGSGISSDGESMTLRLSFPLAKRGSRVAPEPNPNSKDDKLSVDNGGARLSLQGLLHMLWSDAGLNGWQGGEPDRTWEYVFQNLNLAVEGKVVKQHPLGRFLYIPQPFAKERIEESEGDRKKRFIEHAVNEGKKGHELMLLVGELKKIEAVDSGGYRAIVNHVPGFSFIVNDHLFDRIEKNYKKEDTLVKAVEAKCSHQIVAATFSVMPEGPAEIEEITYMPVTAQWIPFDNLYQEQLFAKLIETKRSFTHPLRYNRAKGVSMPSAVLTDASSGPTALYVVTPEQDMEKIERGSLEVDYIKWFWELKASEKLPELPARLETTEDETGYLQKTKENLSPEVLSAPIEGPVHPFLNKAPRTAPQANSSESSLPSVQSVAAVVAMPAAEPEPFIACNI